MFSFCVFQFSFFVGKRINYLYEEIGLQLEEEEVVVVVSADSTFSTVVVVAASSDLIFELLTDEINLLNALSVSFKRGSPSLALRSISFFKLTMSFGLQKKLKIEKKTFSI